jgi:hypothetical protein
MIRTLSLCMALLLSTVAQAHAPPTGKHGGPQVNAGPYHVEAVIDGRVITVYITDHGGAVPRQADSLSATARMIASDGSALEMPLRAQAAGVLSGEAEKSFKAPPLGTVEIRTPVETTVRATFR